MQTITLYRTVLDNGRVVVSPDEPEAYDSTLYRLVADDGKELVKDDVRTFCIDVESTEGWIEEDAAMLEISGEIIEGQDDEKEDMRAALEVLEVTNE